MLEREDSGSGMDALRVEVDNRISTDELCGSEEGVAGGSGSGGGLTHACSLGLAGLAGRGASRESS